jgi:hypothetical protein
LGAFGYGVIDTSLLWGRIAEANDLLKVWTDEVAKLKDHDAVLAFARSHFENKNYWPVARVLESFAKGKELSPEKEFQFDAMGSVALFEVYRSTTNRKQQDPMLKMQADWAAVSATPEALEKSIHETTESAKKVQAAFKPTSDDQKALMKRYELICEIAAKSEFVSPESAPSK